MLVLSLQLIFLSIRFLGDTPCIVRNNRVVMEKEEELHESSTPCLHLVSAFLACEPPDFVVSFARLLVSTLAHVN